MDLPPDSHRRVPDSMIVEGRATSTTVFTH